MSSRWVVKDGMIWCAGWRLASAVSNAGALGIIGAGSMYPEILREHIRKCKAATNKPFAVNVPLLYPNIEEHMATIAEEGVRIVFTSAGNPATWTGHLKEKGITVVHVTASVKFARKAVDAGVRLPNVNEDYTGKAPDLGAYEVGRPAPVYGPRAGTTVAP